MNDTKMDKTITLLLLMSSVVNGLKNCISEPIFLPNENISVPKNNFTFDQVIVDNIWISSDNKTSHNAIPSISKYEKGKPEFRQQ